MAVHRVVGRIKVKPNLAWRPAMRLHKQLHQQLIERLETRDDALVATAGLGTEIAAGAARAGRRRELCGYIADWARVCRLEDKPNEVFDAARMVQDTRAAAFEESPDLAERFARIAKRVERSAAAREAWQRAQTPEEMDAFRLRYRALISTLTPHERDAVRRGELAGETPKRLVARLDAALADPGPAGSAALRQIGPEDWRLARTYAVRPAARAAARLRRERREDAAFADTLRELGDPPPVRALLTLENTQQGALARDPETAARVDAIVTEAEPRIRAAITGLPPQATTTRRGTHARSSATGPRSDAGGSGRAAQNGRPTSSTPNGAHGRNARPPGARFATPGPLQARHARSETIRHGYDGSMTRHAPPSRSPRRRRPSWSPTTLAGGAAASAEAALADASCAATTLANRIRDLQGLVAWDLAGLVVLAVLAFGGSLFAGRARWGWAASIRAAVFLLVGVGGRRMARVIVELSALAAGTRRMIRVPTTFV